MGVEVETLLSSEALEATGEPVLEPGVVEAAAQIWEVLQVRLGREEEAVDRGEEQGGKAAFICRIIAIKEVEEAGEVEENLAATAATAAQAATVAQAVTEEMEEMEDMEETEETEVLEELRSETEAQAAPERS